MKKKITTEQELFIQVAAHGDAAAFFSMISSSLRDYFLKLCSHGESVEECTQKVYEAAETLFKKLQHTHPDNFDHWIETEFSALSHNGTTEHEVILDKNLFVQCEKVLIETQKVLFRVARSIKSKEQKKGLTFFFARHKITALFVIIALLISIVSIISYRYHGFRFDMSFLKAKQNKSSQQNDSTAVVSSDTAKIIDSIASSAAVSPPVPETKLPPPPVPKPRPRVTYTTPATESEGSGAHQSPRTSSYDQTQQPIQSRSERVNQSSYSSQNQSSESSASYSSSGSSTYSSQQSAQSQSPSTPEQNQP